MPSSPSGLRVPVWFARFYYVTGRGLGLAYASAAVLVESMLYLAKRVGPELFYWLLVPASVASACIGVYAGWALVRWRLGWRTLALYGLIYAVVMGAAVAFLRPGLLLVEGFPSSVALLGLQQAYHASLGFLLVRFIRSRLKRLGLLLFLYVFYPLTLLLSFMAYEDSWLTWYEILTMGLMLFLVPYPAMVLLVDLEPPYNILEAVVPAAWMILVIAAVAYYLLGGRSGDVPPSRERAWRPLLVGALCLALIVSGAASAAIYTHAYTRSWGGAYTYCAMIGGPLDSEFMVADVLVTISSSQYVVSLSRAEYTLTLATNPEVNASCRVYVMPEREWRGIHHRALEAGRISWTWSLKLESGLETLNGDAAKVIVEELGARESLRCNTTGTPIRVQDGMIAVVLLEVPVEGFSMSYHCRMGPEVFSGNITGPQLAGILESVNEKILWANETLNCALSTVAGSLVHAKLVLKTKSKPDPWPLPGALVAGAVASSVAVLALIWRRLPAGGSINA